MCRECNNSTGSWYGNAYVDFAYKAHKAIQTIERDEFDRIGFNEIYPLRFIKQVISMFCSINHGYMNPLFEPLREFVLNKEKIGLDKAKYKLCMYLTDSRIMKYNGLSVVLNLKVAPVESMALSEITAYPFGFILYLNPTDTWEYKGVDITKLADCDYDCKVQVDIPWKIKVANCRG